MDRLYQEAEIATEKYNGAKEKADAAGRAGRAAGRGGPQGRSGSTPPVTQLGSVAAAQYRTGGIDPAVQLALSSDPDQYLDGRRARRPGRHTGRPPPSRASQSSCARSSSCAAADGSIELNSLKSRQAELEAAQGDGHRQAGEGQAAAEPVDGRAAGPDLRGGPSRPAAPARARRDRASRSAPRGSAQAPNARAAAAVSFAYGELGSPYVWGATGPNAFDCSGLIQAAYRSAGVALPRTTYTQINAGRRVSRSELAPGDLVFFYSGISHVGIYVGNGQMIHAPNPTAPVRLAPVDQMPFAGATRVG